MNKQSKRFLFICLFKIKKEAVVGSQLLVGGSWSGRGPRQDAESPQAQCQADLGGEKFLL